MKLAFAWRPVDFSIAFAHYRVRAALAAAPVISAAGQIVGLEPLLALALYARSVRLPGPSEISGTSRPLRDHGFWGGESISQELRDVFVEEALALTAAQRHGFRLGLGAPKGLSEHVSRLFLPSEYGPAHRAGSECRYLLTTCALVVKSRLNPQP